MIAKIISGGQCGVDQSALFTAVDLGIATGGWAPKGWRTDIGPAPWLADFGLVEHSSSAYPPRTHANVRDSDGTLVFGWPDSTGCTLTARACKAAGRPLLVVRWLFPDQKLRVDVGKQWVEDNNIQTLNIAGNRERMNPGVSVACKAFLKAVFS